jgi:hypothetical protein
MEYTPDVLNNGYILVLWDLEISILRQTSILHYRLAIFGT